MILAASVKLSSGVTSSGLEVMMSETFMPGSPFKRWARSQVRAALPPLCPACLQLLGGKREHIPNRACAHREHDQPIEPDRNARRGGQALVQRVQETLVDRIELFAQAAALGQVRFHASPLLDRIDELAKCVAKLEAPRVKLEALDHIGLARFA